MGTLREARVRRLLSIRKLAALAGVAPLTIQLVERGQRVPQFGTMQKLAAALEVDPQEIAEFRRAMEAAVEGKEAA
jgi:transcriptional regulator with XRE-family HTH domain